MTTESRCVVSREDATSWPLFDSLGAGQIGAVSAVCLRSVDEAFSSAVQRASDCLRPLFTEIQGELQLALFAKPISWPQPTRSSRLIAIKAGCWNGIATRRSLPSGHREEFLFPEAPTPAIGRIIFPLRELALALEVVRTERAIVCLARPEVLETLLGRLVPVQSSLEMLRESVALSADGAVTLRGTGEFDDREVCTEALGRPAALASVLGS
jgi:hypothetical protein